MSRANPDAWFQVLAKYERAGKHIDDLKVHVDTFHKSNPCAIAREDDLQASQAIYRVTAVPQVPSEIPLILGDALHNLRSTLDHLVWKMIEAAGATPDPTHTSFPIFEDAKGFADLMPGRVKGLGQRAKEKISSFCPYKTGNYTLWTLHQLNIRDKHRLLLTTCHRPFGHSLTPSEEQEFIRKRDGRRSWPDYEITYANEPIVPLQAGHILRTIPISEANENVGFVIGVAIHEPGITEGMPVTLLTSLLHMEVGLIINTLAPYV